MNKIKNKKKQNTRLIDEAENKLSLSYDITMEIKSKTPEELIHELRVQQIELETMNKKLRMANLALEAVRDRYADLYDFAPVGYFTFTHNAMISEVNLTGASMLGVEREKLINNNFRAFVSSEDFELWDSYFLKVLKQRKKQSCDLAIRRADDSLFYAQLDSIRVDFDGKKTLVRCTVSDITERKLSEDLLQRERRKLKTILDSIPDGIYVVNKQCEIQYANPIIEKEFGEVSNKRCYEYIHDRTEICPWCRNDQIFAGQKVEWDLYYARTKKTYKLFDLPIVNEDGSISKLGLFQDITQQKLIEDIQSFLVQYDYIKAGESFFQSLARHLAEKLEADIACIDVLEDNNISARTLAVWSDGKLDDNMKYALKDTPCGDAVGKTVCSFTSGVCDLFPQDILLQEMKAEAYVGTTLWGSTGQPIGLIALIWRQPLKNPQIAEAVLKLVAIRAAGELERQQAEERLRKSEATLSKVFQTSPAIITITTFSEGRILEVNESFLNTFGFTKEEVIGKTSSELNLWSDINIRNNAVASLYGTGKDMLFEAEFRKKNNELFYWLVSLTPIEINGIDCVLTTGIEITDRKKAEEEKNKLESLLRQAQNMEALGTLAGGIAHDLNNILFPIMGYTDMTMDDLAEDSRAYQNLQEVMKAAARAKALVAQILAFSRQREHEKTIFQIHTVIKEALKLIRLSIPSTIQIIQNIDINCAPIQGDPTQIHQIIMNLCTNAYHAMQNEIGVLEVTLHEVELNQENLAAYPNSLPGAYLQLSVSDTGVGIKQDILEKIFDPFFTTKPVGRGTGLGLSVVHGIVKQMNGHIRVKSELEKGTVFDVFIPVIRSENTDISLSDTLKELTTAGSEKILLVDDEESVLNMLRQMLGLLGYQVTSRTSSIEGLNVFQNKPDSFDLVITDMSMPNMSGVQLTKKLIEIRADIPIIMCTGFSEQINEKNAKELGIKGYLMKPVIRSELIKMIRKVLS